MGGLVPAIHVFIAATLVKTWMPGTGPRLSGTVCAYHAALSMAV